MWRVKIAGLLSIGVVPQDDSPFEVVEALSAQGMNIEGLVRDPGVKPLLLRPH
jgi:hypothetical protein